MTHTPGPYRVETWSYENGARTKTIVQTENDAICEVLDLWCMDDRATEKKANADLLAAAPDMLAALQACEGALSSFIDGNMNPNLKACEAIRDMALAAIAKATANV